LKYLVLLPAIGTAYVWRNGTGVELPSCTLNSGCAWRCAKLCVSVPLAGISRLRKDDSRTYGELIGVIWLQTSCQPVGIFANTRLLWNWPAVAFPLYFSLIVAQFVATATSP